MKKCLTLFAAVFILGLSMANAQDEEAVAPKMNALKANPLGLIIGIGKINYERKLSEASSAQLGVSFWSFSNGSASFSGLGLIPEYRFYVTKEAINGFYLAPFYKYNNYTVKDTDSGFKGSLNVNAGGAKAGYNWLLGKKESFVIDLAFGGKYSDFNLKVKEGSESDFTNDDLFSGFSPELHFAIGFAF